MKNQEFATLIRYERINGSNLGNPNYRVVLDDGKGLLYLRSSSNCSWCYGINDTWVNKTVSYHTTKSERIDYMSVTTLEDTFTDKILNREG